MKSLRLAIVTRRFWPFSGMAEMATLDLATQLHSMGHHVEVVTAKWKKGWPTYFDIRGVPVTRIIKPAVGPWGLFRFQRQLSRTLQSLERFDGVIACGTGDESLTVAKTFGTDCRLITRLDYRQAPYHQWPAMLTRRAIAGLNAGQAIAVDSRMTAQRLDQYPVDAGKIRVVEGAVTEPTARERTNASQATARSVVSDAHPILTIEPNRPLVITAAPMDDDGGMLDLVNAWKHVIAWNPAAKLWLMGTGAHGRRVWDRINAGNMVYSIIMPGFFDELSDVFDAADLYVHPLRSPRSCRGLKMAMNHGLCAVATASEFTRELIVRDQTGIVAPPGNPRALAEAILYGLQRREMCQRLGNAAKTHVARSHSLCKQAKTYVDLITGQQDSAVPSLP